MPMCGVPHHAARGYLAQADRARPQGRDRASRWRTRKLAKGLVKREVVRVVTPGIVLDEEHARAEARALPRRRSCADGRRRAAGWRYLDATTGELARHRSSPTARRSVDELARIAPRELLASPASRGARAGRARSACACDRAAGAGAVTAAPSADALEAGAARAAARDAAGPRSALAPLRARAPPRPCVAYARATQPAGTLPVARAAARTGPADTVVLDEAAIANLELVETTDRPASSEGSLLDVLDETRDRAGRAPAAALAAAIRSSTSRRSAAATTRSSWLVERAGAARASCARELGEIADLERLAGRATLGVATPRDLGRAARARSAAARARRAPRARRGRASSPLPALLVIGPRSRPTLRRRARRDIAAALVDEPPPLVKDGGVIRARLLARASTSCRRLADGGKDEILAIEARERKRTGIALAQGPLQPRLRLLHRDHRSRTSRRCPPTTSASRRSRTASATSRPSSPSSRTRS